MIQANELRIGNLVMYNGYYRQIVSLNLGTEVNAKPIELTEEILLKCGFIKDEFDQWGNDSRLGFFQAEDFEGYLMIWGDSVIRHCEHLHQLQNLYFALTGKELKIKL